MPPLSTPSGHNIGQYSSSTSSNQSATSFRQSTSPSPILTETTEDHRCNLLSASREQPAAPSSTRVIRRLLYRSDHNATSNSTLRNIVFVPYDFFDINFLKQMRLDIESNLPPGVAEHPPCRRYLDRSTSHILLRSFINLQLICMYLQSLLNIILTCNNKNTFDLAISLVGSLIARRCARVVLPTILWKSEAL